MSPRTSRARPVCWSASSTGKATWTFFPSKTLTRLSEMGTNADVSRGWPSLAYDWEQPGGHGITEVRGDRSPTSVSVLRCG